MSGSNGKKLLKSVSIYGSYRKNKTGVPFFGTPDSGVRFVGCVLKISGTRKYSVQVSGISFTF